MKKWYVHNENNIPSAQYCIQEITTKTRCTIRLYAQAITCSYRILVFLRAAPARQEKGRTTGMKEIGLHEGKGDDHLE